MALCGTSEISQPPIRRGVGWDSPRSRWGESFGTQFSSCSFWSPKAFDRPATNLPDNVHYVGPVLDREANHKAWDLPWALDHPDPLVLVSFSTTYMAQEIVLQRALDAVAGLRIHVLVTTGPSVDLSLLVPSSNTVVRQHVDHQTVLPHTAAVVTHAGFGTVMAALSHAVPLLCVPMGRDQGANSEHVEACGAGRAISPDASAEEMRAALSDVLESPKYKQGAQSMARIIKREANGSKVVPLLESLLPNEVD
jgi:MGT family glycosyltransferase